MNTPTPALVPQRAVQRLPRLALLLLCAAYVLPGLFGRDPWRNADVAAYGYMQSLARGSAGWLEPLVGGIAPGDGALLPYWLGAAAIRLLGPLLGDPALAARLPFGLLLVGVLALTWYSTYHLARTEAAQPVPFAFGGEAQPIDYARAIADGALLALIASLGLLQLGHETTPELVQLFALALYLYALAASPWRVPQSRLTVMLALPALAASGAPTMALGLGLVGLLVCSRSTYPQVRSFAAWVVASTVLSLAIAVMLEGWVWRIGAPSSAAQPFELIAWFTWPSWALALLTLWRWRRHWQHRHISVPAAVGGYAVLTSVLMAGNDRALMLALPPLAVLAAFALPTLQRSVAAAIDWFSVFFCSAGAIAVWVVYSSLRLGVPSRPAQNVAKLAPGHPGSESWLALALAVAGTLAWIAIVRWRTGRHQHALWKSLVLPAAGVALCWLLAMTLLLPVLDHARSYGVLMERLARHLPKDACLRTSGVSLGQVAALESLGGWRVDARPGALDDSTCPYLLTLTRPGATDAELQRPGWTMVARVRRLAPRDEQTVVYRQSAP